MIFEDEYVKLNVTFNSHYSNVNIAGVMKKDEKYDSVILIAPNPIDRMSNYSGSGLPFPNHVIAFENTPNNKNITNLKVFNTVFKYPNSFYMPNGTTKIISSIFIDFTINNRTIRLKYELHDINALRTLVNRSSRTGPEFYAAKDYLLPIDTAENVLYAYAKAKIENDIG